jgi:hypothetical protein
MPVFDTADVWFVVIKLLADGNKSADTGRNLM